MGKVGRSARGRDSGGPCDDVCKSPWSCLFSDLRCIAAPRVEATWASPPAAVAALHAECTAARALPVLCPAPQGRLVASPPAWSFVTFCVLPVQTLGSAMHLGDAS